MKKIENARIKPLQLPEPAPAESKIVINGIQYRLLDFDNEFTLNHYKKAKPYLNELLKILYDKIKEIPVESDGSSMTADKLDSSLGFDLLNAVLEFDSDIELLALIYCDDKPDGNIFNEMEYLKRIENFGLMNQIQYNSIIGALQNFLSLKIQYMQENASIYLKALTMQK